MRAQERRIRAKPAIAFAAEQSARENIQTKLKCLLDLVKMQKTASPAIRESVLKNLPSSARGFNGWTSQQLDARTRRQIGEFRSNSRIALLRSGMLEPVERALASVTAERSALRLPGKREATIAALQRELKLEAQLRKIVEDEVLRLKRQIRELDEANDVLTNQLNAANREASMLSVNRQVPGKLSNGRVVKLSAVPAKAKAKERGR